MYCTFVNSSIAYRMALCPKAFLRTLHFFKGPLLFICCELVVWGAEALRIYSLCTLLFLSLATSSEIEI
jgi:hypothetical protein